MAIVKMKKFSLLALQADKEAVFDAIIRSEIVQLKRSADINATVNLDESVQRERLLEQMRMLEENIAFVCDSASKYNSSVHGDKNSVVSIPKGTLSRPLAEVTFDDFLSLGSQASQVDSEVAQVVELRDSVAKLHSELDKKQQELSRMVPFKRLGHPTCWYADTESSLVQLSQVPIMDLYRVCNLAEEYETVSIEVVDESVNPAIVVAVLHKSECDFLQKAASFGLVKCSFICDVLPSVQIETLQRQIDGIKDLIANQTKEIACLAPKTARWKVYVDYLGLCEKKIAAEGDMAKTSATFVMEGFYPAEREEELTVALNNVSQSIVFYSDEIGEDEFAPTLLNNNGIVKQFESVTNMYTPPTYHEIDPNPIMSIFYFIIFGFMVADMGYGLLLIIAGIAAHCLIKQNTGVKSLLQLFGVCGVAAVLIGALFGSFFCYTLYPGIIPDPGQYPMVMIILSLVLGIIHIVAGIACNIAVRIKHGDKIMPWFTDFAWIIVFLSLIVALFNVMIEQAAYEPYMVLKLPDVVTDVALYVCLGALAVAIISAGITQKGLFGKVKGSFGAAYGIINYFSDIMSYIRVFGLMLSSALMGQVINTLGGMVSSGGGIGYVFAAMVLIFAHVFNLVMGILGVYIHDGRLQYIEFFGKFYAGDGELFVPFGSQNKYTLLIKNK